LEGDYQNLRNFEMVANKNSALECMARRMPAASAERLLIEKPLSSTPL